MVIWFFARQLFMSVYQYQLILLAHPLDVVVPLSDVFVVLVSESLDL